MDAGGMFEARESRALTDYLTGIPAQLPQRPKAVVVSAHWEAPVPTDDEREAVHPLRLLRLPPAMYEIVGPRPARRRSPRACASSLSAAKIPSAEDPSRGPITAPSCRLLTFPGADIPPSSSRCRRDRPRAPHRDRLRRALLRDEGVLIVGSGMSYQPPRAKLVRHGGGAVSNEFDAWGSSVPSSRSPRGASASSCG